MRFWKRNEPEPTGFQRTDFELAADLDYQKLEARRVLSASFLFGAGQLAIDNFDAGQDLTFSQQDATIDGTLTDAYLFELASGSWSGSSTNPGIELESVNGGTDNLLQVATSLFGSADNSLVNIDGVTGTPLNIDLNQIGPSITVGQLELANITSIDSSLQLNLNGDVVLENIEVIDSDPNDAITSPANIDVTATGNINVIGQIRNRMNAPAADVNLVALDSNSDVSIESTIQSSRGNINIHAADSILLGSSASIVSGSSGDIFMNAGSSGIGDDLGVMQLGDGSSIDAANGSAELSTANGGDIWLGSVSSSKTGLAITVNSGGNIFDNTGVETPNLSAVNGTIRLQAVENIGNPDGSVDFFKAISADFELVETEGRLIDVSGGNTVGIQELSTGNTTIAIDADTAYVFSPHDIKFQNRNAPLTQLLLQSDKTISLPDSLTVSENLAIRAANQVLAVDGTIDLTGINLLFETGSTVAIQTTVNQLDITANGRLEVVNSIDLELVDLDCDFLAVHNLGIDSDTFLTAANLSIQNAIVSGPLAATASTGNLTIKATGLSINSDVLADEGQITFDASADIRMNSEAVVSTVGGDIRFDAGGAIEMSDGAKIIAGREEFAIVDVEAISIELGTMGDGGLVELTANDHVTLGSVQTNNGTDSAVRIVSNLGGIVDGGDADPELVSENADSLVTLIANLGIGEDNALETQIARVDATSSSSGDIEIVEQSGIELQNVVTNDGQVFVSAVGNIQATNVQTGEMEIVEDNADLLRLVSTAGSIATTRLNSADDIELVAGAGSIGDTAGGITESAGSASMAALHSIEFANTTSERISIGASAEFAANLIRIGQDGQRAGDPSAQNVFFGSLALTGDAAIVTEDDATELAGASQIGSRLFLASSVSIENQSAATLDVGAGTAQLNASDHVFLGNQLGDSIVIGSVGVVTTDAHLELDAGVILRGETPNQDASVFGMDTSLGTEVDQTLFVTSTAEIIQESGELHARQIGLDAERYIHLAAVNDFNEMIALEASSSSGLTDPTLISQLTALGNIENGEVDSGLAQSIAFRHLSTANVNSVASPTGTGQISGLNSFDGSIFVSSEDAVEINQNIVAVSTTGDPQVTVYVANGTNEDPNINFNSTQIQVSGVQNLGVVNQASTTANFFIMDEVPLPGTTRILVLNADGSADQNIELEYANLGEAGYRVGVVWDSENLPNSPVEDPNTFVANVNDPSEEFDDAIYQGNPTRILQLGGNEGGGETIGKVEAFSRDAVISHQNNPDVFATVTVRNDQNINLFAGDLSTVDNSLNETQQVIRAELDAPKKFALELPPINPINPVEIRSVIEQPVLAATPENIATASLERDVQPFETGDLKWVRVDIPIGDLEEFGDDIRIKDPTREYAQADDAEAFELDDSIGENEIEKIILEIERKRGAEAGYWYKVFKDYRNRDDELFFYHLKTGEIPQPDTGPASDFDGMEDFPESKFEETLDESFEDSNSNADPVVPRSNLESREQNENGDSSGTNDRTGQTIGSKPEFNQDQNEFETNTSRSQLALAANSLLLAAAIVKQPQSENAEQTPMTDTNQPPPKTRIGFSKLDRLKRRLSNRWPYEYNTD